VTVLLFSRQVAKLAQNAGERFLVIYLRFWYDPLFHKPCCYPLQAVYSLVKFGGIRNYLVATWSDEDLQACLDLNLPCADVFNLLAQPLENAKEFTSRDYLVRLLVTRLALSLPHVLSPKAWYGYQVVKWMRPRVTYELVSRGFAVLYSGNL
jgi:hypothetical protein